MLDDGSLIRGEIPIPDVIDLIGGEIAIPDENRPD